MIQSIKKKWLIGLLVIAALAGGKFYINQTEAKEAKSQSSENLEDKIVKKECTEKQTDYQSISCSGFF